jgi:hypothetical protein
MRFLNVTLPSVIGLERCGYFLSILSPSVPLYAEEILIKTVIPQNLLTKLPANEIWRTSE